VIQRTATRAAAFMLAGLLFAIAPASAQRVRFVAGPCTIEASAVLERQAQALAARAKEIVPRLERQLGVRVAGPFRMVLLGADAASDPLTAPLEASAPAWAAGWMQPAARAGAVRVARASRYPYGTIEAVFAHEVTHLLIYDAVGDRVPRWFNEGVATRAGRQWSLEDMMLYSSSLLTTSLPPLTDVDAGFLGSEPSARLAYAASSSFVGWAERHYGEGFVAGALLATRTMPFESAWRRNAGVALEVSESQWRNETLLRYRWIPGVLAASGLLWALLGFLTLVGGVRKRILARAQRRAWAEEEAAMFGPDDAEEAMRFDRNDEADEV
jgi:Peptidase MA superfamily